MLPDRPRFRSPEFISSLPLRDYISLFGPTLNQELPKHPNYRYALKTFRIAQQLESYVAQITLTKRPDLQKRLTKPHDETHPSDEQSSLPTDSLTIVPVDDLTQLHTVTPSQLALMDKVPGYFESLLASGKLLARQWEGSSVEPDPLMPEDKEKEAYVLLDISYSMKNQGKQMFADALALAFLRRAHHEGASLHLTTFAEIPLHRFRARNSSEFQEMVLDILSVGVDGGTDIQRALGYAAVGIGRTPQTSSKSVLLITDGGSKLRWNPLQHIADLYTVQIGRLLWADFREGRDCRGILERWSTLYQEVSTRFIRRKIGLTSRLSHKKEVDRDELKKKEKERRGRLRLRDLLRRSSDKTSEERKKETSQDGQPVYSYSRHGEEDNQEGRRPSLLDLFNPTPSTPELVETSTEEPPRRRTRVQKQNDKALTRLQQFNSR